MLTDTSLAAAVPRVEEEGVVSHRVLFRDLPDPKDRFTELKKIQAYQRYEMRVPPVFTADGQLVIPSKYEEMIPDGTLVAVRGKMKM